MVVVCVWKTYAKIDDVALSNQWTIDATKTQQRFLLDVANAHDMLLQQNMHAYEVHNEYIPSYFRPYVVYDRYGW